MIEFKSIYSDVNVTSDVQRQHAYKFKAFIITFSSLEVVFELPVELSYTGSVNFKF